MSSSLGRMKFITGHPWTPFLPLSIDVVIGFISGFGLPGVLRSPHDLFGPSFLARGYLLAFFHNMFNSCRGG